MSDTDLELACIRGHFEEVVELLKNPTINPGYNRNCPIGLACKNGHLKIVELLLKNPRVNPCDDYYYTIRWASYNGHIDIVNLLLKDPRIYPNCFNRPYSMFFSFFECDEDVCFRLFDFKYARNAFELHYSYKPRTLTLIKSYPELANPILIRLPQELVDEILDYVAEY